MTDSAQHIHDFTRREAALLKRAKGHPLPERLKDWPIWIGDTAMYLHELKNFVEELEKKK